MEIKQITSKLFFKEPDQYLALFITVFAGKPYNERFSYIKLHSEAKTLWFGPNSDGLMLASFDRDTKQLMGYFVGFSVMVKPDLRDALSDKINFKEERCFYIAETLTNPEFRRKKVAQSLVESAIERIGRNYDRGIVRTNASRNNKPALRLWLSQGFKIIPGVSEHVAQKRMNGSIEYDRRIYLTKAI